MIFRDLSGLVILLLFDAIHTFVEILHAKPQSGEEWHWEMDYQDLIIWLLSYRCSVSFSPLFFHAQEVCDFPRCCLTFLSAFYSVNVTVKSHTP